MKKTKNVNRVDTSNSRLRKDKAKNFIESDLKILKEKYKFYSRLITCVHNPHNIGIEDAWGNIYSDLSKIRDILSDKKFNILFSVITVEIHEGKSETAKEGDKEKESNKSNTKSKTEKEEDVKLKDYPHIHAVVFFTSPDGKLIEMSDIIRRIRDVTSFSSSDDIRIDGAQPKGKGRGRQITKNDENFLCYTVKNANHKEPYDIMMYIATQLKTAEEIEFKKQFGNFNCFLIDNSDDKDVIDFVKEIVFRGVLIGIPDKKELIVESKPETFFAEHADNAADKPVTKKQEGFNITLAAVIYYMNENNLKMCNDVVYQKVKTSRRTWEYWGTIDKIFGCLAEPSNNKILLTLLDNKSKIVELSQFEDQKFLPSVEINWYFVEFKDFYLHKPSFLAIKGDLPSNINCGFMNDIITFDMLDNLGVPDKWLSTILSQEFANNEDRRQEFFSRFYSVSLPLIQKDKVLCLIGGPDSRKSSVMEPMRRSFQKEQITDITEGRFSVSDIVGKRLIGMDDTKGAAFKSANMLQLLEGGRHLMVEQKFKSAASTKFSGNLYICTNEFPKEWLEYNESLREYVLKSQYETRLAIFKFENRYKNSIPGYMKRLTSLEIGKIILFTGSFFAKRFLERETGLLISDTYDECRNILQDHEAIYEFQKR
jgi:hypothetical protein